MMKTASAVLALLSLALCLVFPVGFFLGRIASERFKLGLVFSSASWFIFASLWTAASGRGKKP